ncbi:hypothetical protein F2Q69_00060049 [Brassica cretica]|uniref:Uncharacterized protein n=1 Tax=Brassica cretica TaxID=69181 RepID=A0A8S9RR28_BRACR|nr:hypothetical protein F2Q69_00060049 [Brassica cretica]
MSWCWRFLWLTRNHWAWCTLAIALRRQFCCWCGGMNALMFRWRCCGFSHTVPSPLGWIRRGPTVQTTVSLPLLLCGFTPLRCFSFFLMAALLFAAAPFLLFTSAFFFFSNASAFSFILASRVFGDIAHTKLDTKLEMGIVV